MHNCSDNAFSRRRFIKDAALASAAASIGSSFIFGKAPSFTPLKRHMGRLNFEATTLGLGGQASLQWTPPGIDPVKIILKAFALGVNYFDTSNVYGPSQSNYGKAFRQLRLIPGEPGYNERLRRSIFLNSKTMLRFAKGGWKKDGLWNWSDGGAEFHAVDDLKRSLSLIFGDGKGSYPKGAYLDMIMVHALESQADIDAAYEGYDHPDPKAEHIGVLAMLIDYRDGTNLTGLNPKEEKLIRHIGFSGHASPAAMIEMIHRDTRGILDGMLVAINANDRLYFSMQNNVIPVAAANNMGIIAMKVFADGAMYTKAAAFSSRADMVVLKVGSDALPSRKLIEYSLTTPGIHTAIIGTGRIDANPELCQLQQNFLAAQIKPDALSVSDRRDTEKIARTAKEGKTNYFQKPAQPLGAPRSPMIRQEMQDGKRTAQLRWQTAYAGDEPIVSYDILRDDRKIGQAAHKPQIDQTPFSFEESLSDNAAHRYRIATVDAAGRSKATQELILSAV